MSAISTSLRRLYACRLYLAAAAIACAMLFGAGRHPAPGAPVPRLHPIVVATGPASGAFLLGGAGHGRWLAADAMARTMAGGERYRLYSLGRSLGRAKGSKPVVEEPGEFQSVLLAPAPVVQGDIVGVGGEWNPLPRAPRSASTAQTVYRNAVRAVLAEHGMKDAPARITQVLRVDLEGDGTDEVLVTARTSNAEYPVPGAKAGDFSLVLLRKVAGKRVSTFVLGAEFYPKARDQVAPYLFQVAAVLDLDGDGALEVVVADRYYEGAGAAAWQMRSGRPARVLSAGYGA